MHVEEVFRELDRRRAELAADGVVHSVGEDFKVSGLGGAWTMAHHGVACDAIQASARTSSAKKFCEAYRLNKSARYDLVAFTEGVPQALARGWAHKMQYFLDLCDASDIEAGVARPFAPHELVGYVETPEFGMAVRDLHGHARGLLRVNQIRALFR